MMIGSGLDVGDLASTAAASTTVASRHGAAEFVPAHRIDHAANLRALLDDGCTHVLAVSSVGTLRTDWPVGTVVAPDDFFAPWVNPSVFADRRGHTVPGFDEQWRREVLAVWRSSTTTPIVDGGVYVQTIGPRFETPAEVRFLATAGDVVGMTVAAECIVARELGLRYAAVCVVDNVANGLGATPLSVSDYERAAAANRAALSEDLGAVVAGLLDASA